LNTPNGKPPHRRESHHEGSGRCWFGCRETLGRPIGHQVKV
jgi:hypothetical protein